MKKILLILFLLIGLGSMISCEDDESSFEVRIYNGTGSYTMSSISFGGVAYPDLAAGSTSGYKEIDSGYKYLPLLPLKVHFTHILQ